MKSENEINEVIKRYARRSRSVENDNRYSIFNPEVYKSLHERQRELIRLLRAHNLTNPAELKLLEIGCRSGTNLLELIRLGFDPANIIANELLHDRAELARKNLPKLVNFYEGDASLLPFEQESLDIVFQSTVFSSILDDDFRQKLANNMWAWLRPGGGILWYDFTFNNPNNPDVRGVPLSRIRKLFPEAKIYHHRITLAPPLSRIICKISPVMYDVFNFFRFYVLIYYAGLKNNDLPTLCTS